MLGQLWRLWHFAGTLDDEKLDPFLHKKATWQEAIEQQKSVVEALKKARKKTLHHIDVHDYRKSTI